MSASPIIVLRDGAFFSVLRKHEDWGIETYDLASPPRRFWADSPTAKPVVEPSVDARKIVAVPTPAQLLRAVPSGDSWQAQSRRSIARLWAYYLLCEDPQRRLDARTVVTLAHQVSLVRHVLDNDHLRRVMIADEVGLGKTVEVGLLLAELFEGKPGTRVLYLAPARLVNNVAREFERLELGFRRWKSGDADARLDDPRIIASIHRAAHPKHFDSVVGAGRWNVIVVDECHHLSDWAAGGGDAVVKFRLVRELANRLDPSARLILLSGTPHQGHGPRFENLLRLLRLPDEEEANLHGRVIYRTKEDIRDWRGNPLFPPRQINSPIVLDLGTHYRLWLESIHDFYKPPPGAVHGQARQRAAGWRCAQALQWAASSPQAGLGFLVRQAIRSGWTLENGTFADALACLRPYRNGPPDEPLAALYSRLEREVGRQLDEGDIDDIEDEFEDEAVGAAAERAAMEALLKDGVKVLRQAGDEKWRALKDRILDPAGDEKVVLFAQPIETVIALARYLERVTGERPAIMGGQSDIERQQEEDSFRKRNGPRFLVSSRAGGEGINLQVARRLVHVDVPWNPMELEQRVGRVHRFGSRKMIIVDTLVVGESREADAYRIARNKLRTIASTLSPERFEMIFSRVMSLVPPEELQSVMLEEAAAPLSEADANRLAEMVESGFRQWRTFHDQFHAEQQRIRQLSGGLADWQDIEDFLVKYADAEAVEGFRAHRFEIAGAVAQPVEDVVNVFRMADGTAYATGDTQGASVFGPNDESVQQLGLNSPPMAVALRTCAFPKLPTGAAHLRVNSDAFSQTIKAGSVGLLIFLIQPIKAEDRSGWNELTPRLACFEIGAGGFPKPLEGKQFRILVRALLGAAARTKGSGDRELTTALCESEAKLFQELRRPTEEQIAAGIRHAVTPLFAGILDLG